MKFYRPVSQRTPDSRLLVQSATIVAVTALAFVSLPSEQQLLKAAAVPRLSAIFVGT